jgi:carbamoyl-phosphate synthase large subunit
VSVAREKLLHVLGGGFYQMPAIRTAHALGHRVLVTDMYAERPAYALADEHEVIDIVDRERTLAAARRHGIDGILCDTTDVGVPTMAYVAEELGLPGIGLETALDFTDKLRMRQRTSAAGVPGPEFRAVRTPAELRAAARELGLPLVVKPTDSQGSRGVQIVRAAGELDAALAEALRHSNRKLAIAETFIDGLEVTVEGMCIEGEPYVVGISDKDHFAHRPEVANRLTYPADLTPRVLARIAEVNRAVVRALGLRTGVTHAEYFVRGEEVLLVEIAARGGGSHVFSHIVPWLAGVDVPRMYLEHVLGTPMRTPPDGAPRAANLAFFDFPLGRVTRIAGVEEARRLPGVEVLLLGFAEGDTLEQAREDRLRHGQALVFGRTRAEVLATTRRAFELVRVEVERNTVP